MATALNSGKLMSLLGVNEGGGGNYFSLITLVPCTVVYSPKIFIFNIGNHLKRVI